MGSGGGAGVKQLEPWRGEPVLRLILTAERDRWRYAIQMMQSGERAVASTIPFSRGCQGHTHEIRNSYVTQTDG